MPITNDTYNGYHDKAKWDISVALRGPDSYYGETVKWYTTSVIRGHVRGVMRVGGLVNDDLKLVVLPSDKVPHTKGDKGAWNASHFIEHIRAAANWMGVPILYVPGSLWCKVMQLPTMSEAGQRIIKHFRGDAEGYTSKDLKLVSELERHVNDGCGGQY